MYTSGEDKEATRFNLIESRLRFLHRKLGAVLKGYKVRRIFNNNQEIRLKRVQYREIINFVCNLKNDIYRAEEGTPRENQIKQILIIAIKDL